MEAGINNVSKIIPLVRNLIAPVLIAIFEEQNTCMDTNLCKTVEGGPRSWQISVAISSQTKLPHTNNDNTYTFVNEPKQERNGNKKIDPRYTLVFRLIDDKKIVLL